MINLDKSARSALAVDAAAAFVASAAALFVAELIHTSSGLTRLSILFLAAVTVTASIRGARAGVVAALIGVLFYNVFLNLRTPDQSDVVEDLLNVVIFLIVALITGTLAGRVHDEAARSRVRAERMESLFRASGVISEEDGQAFWPTLADTLSRATGGAALVIDPGGSLQAQSGDAERQPMAGVELGTRLLRSRHAGIEQSDGWRARLMGSPGEPAGVLVWEAEEPDPELEGVIALLADLGSASIVRTQSREEQLRRRAAEEASRLREALLSSISHDFRSPLAAIIGSSTSLLEYGDKFDEPVKRDLLLNIQHEGEKLNQFVANLLNMIRLQSGVIEPAKESVSAAEVVGAAIGRLERHTRLKLPVRMQGDCEIEADPLLLEQAVYNVLDNAVKYGNGEKGIDVLCRVETTGCQIIVADGGPGLPDEDQGGVFRKFHFARSGARSEGTGLGLSISKGFVEAMGGTINARNRSDGRPGLEVAISLRGHCQ